AVDGEPVKGLSEGSGRDSGGLQNENQCLKKNISALLKTARVEITRKQDEIDHLNQSLLAGPRRHHTHAIPSLLRGVRSIIAQEIKMPRDARLNNSDIAARTEVNAHGGPRINIVEKEKVGCSSEVPKEKDVDRVDKTEASSVFSDGTKRGNFSKNTSEKLDTTLRSSGVKTAETVVRSEAVVKERFPEEKEKFSDTEDIGKQSTSKHQIVKLCKESSETHLPEQMSTDHPEPTDKLANKEKDTEYQRKDHEHRRRKEEWQDISASSQSERETFDLRERLQNSSIRRKSEGSQKNTHFDMNYESSKKYCTLGSHDKLDTTGSKTLLRDDSGSQNMLKATCETSKHERETGVYRRDRSTDRRKSDEKDNLLRKTKLIPDLYAKDERSHKSSKGESTHRRNHDDNDRREKPSSAYSKDLKSLSRTSKELNLSLYHKDETSSSKNDRNDRESKSDKQDQEKRGGEKKRYREDRDKCNYERKEHKVQKEGEKLPSQSPNKRKSVNLCRSESLTERTDSRSTVDDGKKMLDEELNSPKDLKLSFMQTLNLTLSPAKKDTPSEEDTSMESIPDSKEKPNTGVSEVSLDSSFVLPKSMGSPGEIKTKQCLHNPADVPKPNLPKNLSGGSLDVVSKVDVPKCHSDNPVHIASKTDVRKPNSDILVDDVPKTLTDYLVDNVSNTNVSKPFLISLVDADSKLDALKQHTDMYVVGDSKTNFTKSLSDTSMAVFSKAVAAEHCSDKPVDGLSKTIQEQLSNNSVDAGSKIDLWIEQHVKSPPTTVVLKKDVAPSNSPAERRISPKQSTINMKDKSKLKTKKKAASISNMSKNVNDISCLDGIVKIIPLSSIEDVLQMLQAIRMRMRSKYMKFKVQVSAQQFYNVIEYGSLRFRILVESLDWSVVCSSPESLKRSICKCVESKFKRIKKNGIVDRIFEQHLTDMKKKLWQFVDDQLDSLFDTLKTMLANLCDKAKPERDGSKSKLTVNATSNTEGPSAAHVKGTRHFGSKAACSSNKLFAPELLCSRQRPFEKKCDPNVSSSKQPCVPPTNKAVQIEVVKDVSLQFSSTPLNTGAPKPIQDCLTQSVSPKSDHSLKNTSGLSFDLVSDAHMGDIFKSLLNDADHVQNEDVQEENAWFCISPEKSSVEQKSEIVISPAEATTPVKTSPERLPPSWPLASPSPNRLCSYTTLLHPDILDESCMLEIPCSVSFKSFESLEDRSKSFHSILLEDLAVSLTVPSPLKSDSHLSFLRGSGVSQSAHDSAQLMISQNNEGVQLEEEDATEQDIHLTLDSENSSRCSSPVASEPPAFQYHPSEPMQAVIMEKSNDHFIVKIRRAVSSNSPASDRSTAECMGSGLSPLEDQDMRAFFEATGRNADTVLRTMEKDENDMLCQVKTCTDGNDLPKDISGKRDDESVTPQLLLNSSTPERKGSDLKSPKDSRPETFTPTDFGDSGSPLENSNKRTKALDVVPINLEPDPLSSRMLPNPTTAENSDTGFVRKRKKSLKAETEAKRQKVSSFITENEQMKSLHAENSEAAVLATDKTLSKHKKSASDRAIKRSTKCHQNNLSAKNVVKKKGEVVVSWTR
uniref:Caspase 8 associated protein 2 n=1 Tax=Leptobrachium leishanense TaxID=445787 RepID=A0A8C5QE73_9ANUR